MALNPVPKLIGVVGLDKNIVVILKHFLLVPGLIAHHDCFLGIDVQIALGVIVRLIDVPILLLLRILECILRERNRIRLRFHRRLVHDRGHTSLDLW